MHEIRLWVDNDYYSYLLFVFVNFTIILLFFRGFKKIIPIKVVKNNKIVNESNLTLRLKLYAKGGDVKGVRIHYTTLM
jgi:hypothetical protein